MANRLTRYDPFTEPFEDLMKRVFRPVRWELEPTPMDIKLDVTEGDDAYTVKAEIPGVKKDEIAVEVDGNLVTIRAESKRETDVKEKGQVIRSERYYGSLFRSFSLSHEVDETKADAKYADGILTLTLPKKATATAKALTVH